MLAGVPGAGKSTYAARNFHAHEIAAFDDASGLMLQGCADEWKPDSPLGNPMVTYKKGDEAYLLLRNVVAARSRLGGKTCVDATNLRLDERLSWLSVARRSHTPIHAVVFNVPLWLALWRNAHPVSTIPDETIRNCYEQSRVMLENIENEGFDSVLRLPGHEAQDELDQQECSICKGSLRLQGDDRNQSGYSFQCEDCDLIYPLMDPKPTLGVVYGGV